MSWRVSQHEHSAAVMHALFELLGPRLIQCLLRNSTIHDVYAPAVVLMGFLQHLSVRP
jgi:hypothetical protein